METFTQPKITGYRQLNETEAALMNEIKAQGITLDGLALTDLARQGRTFGLTFIDGYHRFDDVLVDFTLAARMCPEGGVIVLHDMWLPSIAAVASFLRTNRVDFAEVQTGCPNLFAMRRIADDERDWTHFVAFPLR